MGSVPKIAIACQGGGFRVRRHSSGQGKSRNGRGAEQRVTQAKKLAILRTSPGRFGATRSSKH
jgi:hypothetical protein